MNAKPSKIRLQRETLRSLVDQQLAQVAGGYLTQGCPGGGDGGGGVDPQPLSSGPSWCGCRM